MKNEVKVGILSVVALVILLWGYNFLKGKNIFSGGTVLKAEFKTVVGLNIAAPVLINGFKVGAVTSIYQDPKYDGTIIAELSLEEKVQLPKNTKAVIITPSLMSGNAISLEFQGTCQGDCLASGDKILGEMGGLTMVQDALGAVKPYLAKLDTLAGTLQEIATNPEGEVKQSMKDVQATIANLKAVTELLNGLLAASSANLQATMGNVKSITENIKNSNEEISAMLSNLKTLTEQFKAVDLAGTTQEAKVVFTKLGTTLDQVQGTVAKTNEAIGNVVAATDFSKQQGIVNALLHDPKLRADIQKTMKDLELLLQDLRLHPERYRTVLSGKKKPYISPEEEEAKKNKKKKKKE